MPKPSLKYRATRKQTGIFTRLRLRVNSVKKADETIKFKICCTSDTFLEKGKARNGAVSILTQKDRAEGQARTMGDFLVEPPNTLFLPLFPLPLILMEMILIKKIEEPSH